MPTVCLVMIAHNEALVLPRSLASAKPLVDHYVIALNGTTDNSVEVIKTSMCGVPGEIHETEWKGWAHNRNEVITLAKGKSDYLLMLDADDVFEWVDPNVLRKLPKDFGSRHILGMIGATAYDRMLFFRNDPSYRYVGAAHEVMVRDAGLDVAPGRIEGILYRVVGGGASAENPQVKYAEHARLLLNEYNEQTTKDPRTVFYLAQSYRDCGEIRSAAHWYERRTEMEGFWQEKFVAWLMLGRLRFNLGDEPGALHAYLKAIEQEPGRKPEVCVELVRRLNDSSRYPLAVAFGEMGGAPSSIPPIATTMFVDTSAYEWRLLLEWAVAAWWVGRRDEAKEAFKRLLMIAPPDQHGVIRGNLALCE
jgi:glycosyl transferase family 2